MASVSAEPAPVRSKLYGFSFASSLTIEIVAVRTPTADGLKVTVKVRDSPAGTVALGASETVKSPGFAPEKVIAPMVRTPSPVFSIVKIFEIEALPEAAMVPKSVSSVVDGVASPSTIETAFPATFSVAQCLNQGASEHLKYVTYCLYAELCVNSRCILCVRQPVDIFPSFLR